MKNTYDLFGNFINIDFSHVFDHFNLATFVISTIDFENHIQIIAFGLTRWERKEDYFFILDSLFKYVD